jgi:hypothetical protein
MIEDATTIAPITMAKLRHLTDEVVEILMDELDLQAIIACLPRDLRQIGGQAPKRAEHLATGVRRTQRQRTRAVLLLDEGLDEGRGVLRNLERGVELSAHAFNRGD